MRLHSAISQKAVIFIFVSARPETSLKKTNNSKQQSSLDMLVVV
jgi:hypothetical protein